MIAGWNTFCRNSNMMNTTRSGIWLVLMLMVLQGCTGSKSYVRFEVMEPAKITYPEQVQKIGYLTAAPITVYAFPKRNRAELDPVSLRIIDTIVVNNVYKGFLEGKQFSDLTYLEDVTKLSARKEDTTGRKDLIEKSLRQKAFREFGLDGLIVMEYYETGIYKSPARFDFMMGEYIQEFRFQSEILWRIYVEGEEQPVDEYLARDTLYYVNSESMPASQFMDATDVLRDGSAEIGFRYGLRHIPKWTEVSRVVFRGSQKPLRDAAVYTDQGEWEKAVEIWSAFAENDDPKLAAKANHNLAVYFELQDELEKAEAFASEALELWKNEYTEDYRQELQDRIREKEKILKQVR